MKVTNPQPISGSGSPSVLPPLASGSGETVAPVLPVTGTASVSALAPSMSGSGTALLAITGTASVAPQSPETAATGSLRFIATGDASVLGPDAAGQGAVVVPIENVTGTGGVQAMASYLTASGSVESVVPPGPEPTGNEGPWITHGVVHIAKPPENH